MPNSLLSEDDVPLSTFVGQWREQTHQQADEAVPSEISEVHDQVMDLEDIEHDDHLGDASVAGSDIGARPARPSGDAAGGDQEERLIRLRIQERMLIVQERDKELEIIRIRERMSGSNPSASATSNREPSTTRSVARSYKNLPAPPTWNPQEKPVQNFLREFEQYYSLLNYDDRGLAIALINLIPESFRESVGELPPEEASSYQSLKRTIITVAAHHVPYYRGRAFNWDIRNLVLLFF